MGNAAAHLSGADNANRFDLNAHLICRLRSIVESGRAETRPVRHYS
jgi:hypothetical protein